MRIAYQESKKSKLDAYPHVRPERDCKANEYLPQFCRDAKERAEADETTQTPQPSSHDPAA
jgi:hypothetical protein